MRINTLIVEDDAGLRQTLEEALQLSEELTILEGFGDSESFLSALPHIDVEVVIMDIQLPGITGIEAVRKAKLIKPRVEYLMWTSFDTDQEIFDALCEGAGGYLLKKSAIPDIIQAVMVLHSGGSPMSPEIARKVIQTFRQQRQPSEAIAVLSDREREILDLIAQGFRYKEVAHKLFISIETVRTHLRNVYTKLEVQSKTDAINKIYPRS